jgi:hypothetical protein
MRLPGMNKRLDRQQLERIHSFVWGFAYTCRSRPSVDRFLFNVRSTVSLSVQSIDRYIELLLLLDSMPKLALPTSWLRKPAFRNSSNANPMQGSAHHARCWYWYCSWMVVREGYGAPKPTTLSLETSCLRGERGVEEETCGCGTLGHTRRGRCTQESMRWAEIGSVSVKGASWWPTSDWTWRRDGLEISFFWSVEYRMPFLLSLLAAIVLWSRCKECTVQIW